MKYILFVLSISLSLTSCSVSNTQKYSLSYRAPGHENLYKNLKEIKSFDEKINNIIDYSKKIAKDAGYSIIGDNLDTYLFKRKEYPIEIKVYENKEYYLILLLPKYTPRTSLELNISIYKKTNEIIAILQGS